MPAYFDANKIEKISGLHLIIDTNVLSSCSSDVEYLYTFITLFKENYILIDPIVRLEFLRTAYTEELYIKKASFLQYNHFNVLTDHQEIFRKTFNFEGK